MKRRSRAGGEPIKGRRRKTPEPKRRNAPKAVPRLSSSTAEEGEVASLTRELNEAREQQAATSEVLQVISGSHGDLQPVFATMLEKAVRICDAKFGNIYRWDGDALHLMASHNIPATRSPNLPGPQTPTGRMIATKTFVHVPDLAAELAYAARDPWIVDGVELAGVRTLLIVPMLKEDELIGVFIIYRQEVRPFTDKQIEIRQELRGPSRHRHRERAVAQRTASAHHDLSERTADLTEALEQQTATSEVLQVISSSPGDLEPVFATMLENAVRICDAKFGNIFRWDGERVAPRRDTQYPASICRSSAGAHPSLLVRQHRYVAWWQPKRWFTSPILRQNGPTLRNAIQTLVAAVELGGIRTVLAVPMLKEDELIGVVHRVSPGSSSIHRQADRTGQELRRPSCHRHRERAVAQRAAPAHRRPHRGVGAADSYVRSAASHLQAPRRS